MDECRECEAFGSTRRWWRHLRYGQRTAAAARSKAGNRRGHVRILRDREFLAALIAGVGVGSVIEGPDGATLGAERVRTGVLPWLEHLRETTDRTTPLGRLTDRRTHLHRYAQPWTANAVDSKALRELDCTDPDWRRRRQAIAERVAARFVGWSVSVVRRLLRGRAPDRSDWERVLVRTAAEVAEEILPEPQPRC